MIREHISLKALNTFRIGGTGRFFCAVSSVVGLKEAILFAREKSLPIFVLGEGSNILISDQGFPGLVIKMDIGGIEWQEQSDGEVLVTAGAGENWDNFVALSVERGLHGVENLSSVPGSVGATPVQNIGAYGAEVKEVIAWVEVFDTVTLETRKMSVIECQFGYRDSIFKHTEGAHLIIVRVAYLLKKDAPLKTDYKDVEAYFKRKNIIQPVLLDVRNAVVEIRRNKLPDLKKFGTAGSFFKNPIISVETYKELSERFPGIPSYEVDKKSVKIPIAWVLDKVCNFKGYREGDVGIYENQPLVLVNFGDGTAAEIQALAKKMIESVREKTGITIEPEVGMVGFV